MEPYTYNTSKAASASALAEWTFESYVTCETSVLPDGCRDIIVQQNSQGNARWFISNLSHAAYTVPSVAGMHFHGIRLQPGVEIRQSELRAWMQGKDPAQIFLLDQLDEFCIQSDNLSNALTCLASGQRSVLCVAKELGVSLRTLERLVKTSTGESPSYWFSLARIRKAGRTLVDFSSLSDAAIEAGFADQSHMNREMKKWFQQTPKQFKADKQMQSLLSEPGYG